MVVIYNLIIVQAYLAVRGGYVPEECRDAQVNTNNKNGVMFHKLDLFILCHLKKFENT
jgi:hypothetical protein